MNNLEPGNTHQNKTPLNFVIEGVKYETFEQYLTGGQLKKISGIPLETELYLSISKPYKDELIENDKSVNLARPETEYFFVKKKLHFSINGTPFTWYKQFITGAQIRELGNIPLEDEIFLDIKEGWQDDQIMDDEIVDLARDGREKFISKKISFEVEIQVNGKDHKWVKKVISFDEIVTLKDGATNGTKAYTVTYKDGPIENPSGELAKGDVVIVKNRMKFYAKATDKS